MLIAGRLAGCKYSHRGCVLALLGPIPTVRRYDIPNVRVDHFSRSARHDDHHHGGLFRNGRGASRRLHWRNCVRFDGADRESGALRWHEHERSPYREASSSRKVWSQASSFCSCRNSPTRGSWSGSSLPTSCLCASQHTVMCRKKSWAAS